MKTSDAFKRSALILVFLVFVFLLFELPTRPGKAAIFVGAGRAVVVMHREDRAQVAQYRKNYFERNRPNANKSRQAVRSLVHDTQAGRYKSRAEDFEQACNEVDQLLMDSLSELDAYPVPPSCAPSHVQLSTSYRPLHQCLETLRDSYNAKADLRTYRDAEACLREGTAEALSAEAALTPLVAALP